MDPTLSIFLNLLIVTLLTIGNGVFAGAEIAIISVRKTRLAELQDQGSAGASALFGLRENPERFLATVQIALTMLTVTAAALGGAEISGDVAPYMQRLGLEEGPAHTLSFWLMVGVQTFLTITIGELVPKSLAMRYAERYALLLGPVLAGLATVSRPLVRFLTWSSNLVLGVFGDSTTFTETRHTREELQQLLDETAVAGNVDEQVSEIASRALDFEDLDASDVMVPRSDIRCIPRGVTAAELSQLAHKVGHARLPVFEGSQENIVGLINVREALAYAHLHGQLEMGALLHPVLFVAENMAAPAVLRELQNQRSHLAVVVDEQGSVRGLVTVEDLVEELVGEIFSENDTPTTQIRVEPDGAALVMANVAVHEVNRELSMELPEGENFSTLAGLCIHLAGRIPAQGDVLEAEEGYRIEVVEATPRRVRLVRIRRSEADTEETAKPSSPPEP